MSNSNLFSIFTIEKYNIGNLNFNSIHISLIVILLIISLLSMLISKNNLIHNCMLKLWDLINNKLETDKYPEYKTSIPFFFSITLMIFIFNIISRTPGIVPIISLLKVSLPLYSCIFFYFLYVSIRSNGIKIINIFFNSHIILPIRIFIGILEIISYFLKIVIFSIRILASITAGHILMAVIETLINNSSIYLKTFPYIFLVVIYMMEICTSLLQSYIFIILSTNIFKSIQKTH